jgi:WD40 repeat protein
VASGKESKAFTGPQGGVNAVAFHPDGKRLAVAGSEVVEVWNLETVRKLLDLKGHRKWVYCVAYSPDGKWLASGAWDGTVMLRDAATADMAQTIFAHAGEVLGLAFSPDSRNLVTAGEDRSTQLWEVPSGRRLATFHGHTDFVQAVAFRPDGREVATGSLDGSIRFCDLKTSRPVVVEHNGWVEQFAFRRDGLRVLSKTGIYGTDAVPVKGWNPVTGELDAALGGIKFKSLPKEFVFVPGSEFIRDDVKPVTSPDGKLVAQKNAGSDVSSASRSKEYSHSSVAVRESKTGKIVHTLTGHSADIVSLAFSPDGRRLATASYDRTVKLWDMQTGKDVFTLLGHTSGVVSVAFSPDGNQIVTGGIDCTVRVWNATPLQSNATADHDARYHKKVEMLEQLKAATDDAKRAEILAAGGQWGMAAQAFARAVANEPDKLQLRYQLIDAILQAGDRSRVGPACDDILKRFGNSGDPVQAIAVTGLCRLASQALTDPEKRQAVHELGRMTNDLRRGLVLGQYGQWDLVASSSQKLWK